MSHSTEALMGELVPVIYEVTAAQLELPPVTDMSHTNRCDRLTLNMLEAVEGRGLQVRREQHEADAGGEYVWHYLINHAAPGTPPTKQDIITDLNPWQYEDGQVYRRLHRGYLHGPRTEVQQKLADAGAPEWFVSLRGLATITAPHTALLTPYMQHR